jgi:hypothetical protein
MNLYIYQNANTETMQLFNLLSDIQRKFSLESKVFDYLYLLDPKKADHPGDFKSKSISKKNLELGLRSGEIKSFSISNKADLRDLDTYAIYVNDKIHGGIYNISMHIPLKIYNDIFYQEIDNFVTNVSPSYAFQVKTDSALMGVSYILSSTVYKNERGNFSSFLLKNENIYLPRMIYPVNYFTDAQMNFESRNIKLKDFIDAEFGKNYLSRLNSSIVKFEINEENLFEINNLFGEAGYLISWMEPRKRGLSITQL